MTYTTCVHHPPYTICKLKHMSSMWYLNIKNPYLLTPPLQFLCTPSIHWVECITLYFCVVCCISQPTTKIKWMYISVSYLQTHHSPQCVTWHDTFIYFMYTFLCHTCLPMIPPNGRIHYDPTGFYTLWHFVTHQSYFLHKLQLLKVPMWTLDLQRFVKYHCQAIHKIKLHVYTPCMDSMSR